MGRIVSRDQITMTILMTTELFFPFDRGGSEWSTYYLIMSLIKKGHTLILMTPNLGSSKNEIWRKIKIYRFPFIQFHKKNKSIALTPFWFTNIFWFLMTSIYAIYIAKREKIDVLHLQGKYFLPAGLLVKKLLKIPVLVTLRDYQVLCPFGFCLVKKRVYRKCSFIELLRKDYPLSLKEYQVKKGYMFNLLLFIATIRGYFISHILLWCANHVDERICLSLKQQLILEKNGLKRSRVIYNMNPFNSRFPKRRQKIANLAYFGRLTPGKGLWLLIKSFEKLNKKYPRVKLTIFGDGFLKDDLQSYLKRKKIESMVIWNGHVTHSKIISRMKAGNIVIVPSLWEEPFGRIVIEAFANFSPVVTTSQGALPEIVGRFGIACAPRVDTLTRSIELALKKFSSFEVQLKKERKTLAYLFWEKPLAQHLTLYYRLKAI